MFSPRWRKVVRDLWNFKARTILVVISIAVGVLAVGMIAGSQAVLEREMDASWTAVSPASAALYTDFFDDALVRTVRKMPEVEEADARRSFPVRFRAVPDRLEEPDPWPGQEEEQWQRLQLYTVPDYDDLRVFQIRSLSGAWPPPRRDVLIERSSLDWMGVAVGDTILVEAPDGKRRLMQVAGTVHDLTQNAASWTGTAAGYISPTTLEWLGKSEAFDELYFVVAEQRHDVDHVAQVARLVRDKVERSGPTVYFTWVETPGKHPAWNDVQPILMLLGILGLLSLLASGILVINTMQALLAQQVRQIGVMKALGADSGQVMGIYYSMTLVFSLLALAIGMPLGSLGARGLARFIATLVNFDIASYAIPARVLAMEIAVGLVVPLLAALYPIVQAVRTTAREAMADYGLSNGYTGGGLLDWLVERMRALSRPLLLSLRNTFRRRGRTLLTVATLTLSGAIFVSVLSVNESLSLTLDESFNYVRFDVLMNLKRSYRVEQIEREAMRVPGVVYAEAWRFNMARRVRPDGLEGDNIVLRAPRADSALITPSMAEGRWLLPGDENAAVVNTYLIRDEPDVQVGDEIILKIEGDEMVWHVVGIMDRTAPGAMVYVPYGYFSQTVGGMGRASTLLVATERHDGAFQMQVASQLETYLERLGIGVTSTMTSTQERDQIQSRFDVLVYFLLMMAILLSIVGGIGLMGTMSLNVLERTREVGVMRAIGASNGAVLQIVVAEGVMLGLLSWIAGALLAIPLSNTLGASVGQMVMQAHLTRVYSVTGAGLWLVLVVVLAILASLLPARSASRISVREVLAYE